jgi:hypothetical protein
VAIFQLDKACFSHIIKLINVKSTTMYVWLEKSPKDIAYYLRTSLILLSVKKVYKMFSISNDKVSVDISDDANIIVVTDIIRNVKWQQDFS